jgi:hypothetical protein
LEWIAEQLFIEFPEYWYNVKTSTLFHMGASTIIQRNGSLYSLLNGVYPEYDWQPWRFDKMPAGWMENPTNMSRYFDWLTCKLSILNLDDWYDVTMEQVYFFMSIYLFGGSSIVYEGHSDLIRILSQKYPKYPWKMELFGSNSVMILSQKNANLIGRLIGEIPKVIIQNRKKTPFK